MKEIFSKFFRRRESEPPRLHDLWEEGRIETLVQSGRIPIQMPGVASIGEGEGKYYAIPHEPLRAGDTIEIGEFFNPQIISRRGRLFPIKKGTSLTFVPDERIEECDKRIQGVLDKLQTQAVL